MPSTCNLDQPLETSSNTCRHALSCILAAIEGDTQFEILANGTALRRNSSANQDLCQLHGVEFKVDSEIQTGHSTPDQRFLLALVNCDVLPWVLCPPSSVLLQFCDRKQNKNQNHEYFNNFIGSDRETSGKAT